MTAATPLPSRGPIAPAGTSSSPQPPTPASARFTLELEFVLSLSNPYYLSHLATTYPHLLNPPQTATQEKEPTSPAAAQESDSSKFTAYLAYLHAYWRKPEYARFLSHPGATLRSLELLQQEAFRRDVIRPDVIERLLSGGEADGKGEGEGNGAGKGEDGAATGDDGKDTAQQGSTEMKNGASG